MKTTGLKIGRQRGTPIRKPTTSLRKVSGPANPPKVRTKGRVRKNTMPEPKPPAKGVKKLTEAEWRKLIEKKLRPIPYNQTSPKTKKPLSPGDVKERKAPAKRKSAKRTPAAAKRILKTIAGGAKGSRKAKY